MGIRQSLFNVFANRDDQDDAEDTSTAESVSRERFLAQIIEKLSRSLAVVLGQLDSAMIERDTVELTHNIRAAHRNARRLDRLIRQARQLTQFDRESIELSEQRILLVPFIESLVMSFEELAERKGVNFEFFATHGDLVGHFDPDHLTSIVSNLIAGSLTDAERNGRVGIALEALPPDAFQLTVVDTATDRYPGEARSDDNIGRAMAVILAQLYSGTLDAISTSGGGTRTIVTLPLAQSVAGEPGPLLADGSERPEVTEEILHRSTTEFQPRAIAATKQTALVIEENVDLAEWIASELGEVADAQIAHDRAAGINILRTALPDLLVIGLGANEKHHLDEVRKIRADERTSHTTIVAISSSSDSAVRIAALGAGADDLIAMPVGSKELITRATALLERHRSLRETFAARVSGGGDKDDHLSPVDASFYEKVLETIGAEIGNADFSVPELADAVAMSTSQLSRKMRALIDKSPAQLIRTMRLECAARMVADDTANIATICFAVGFNDQSHFTRTFRKFFGVSPSDYRQQAGKNPR